MAERQIACPKCQTMLSVPEQGRVLFARCGRCRHRFVIPSAGQTAQAAAPAESRENGDILSESQVQQFVQQASAAEEDWHEQDAQAASAEGAQAPEGPPGMRMVKFAKEGVLLEFPAEMLRNRELRCAMPRRCLRCGAQRHLLAHVVIFSHQLVDSISLEDERMAGALVLGEDQVREHSSEELLDRMPLVPNVPAPANLPMIYYVCDMCSPEGLIGGQIRSSLCRLGISRPRRAAEFLAAAAGAVHPDTITLQKYVESLAENPWERLSSTVQHRIEQWFKPAGAERFLAYVPDRDHARTEDGMNGVLISTDRLIYHIGRRHYETTLGKALRLQYSSDGPRGHIRITTPAWEVKHLVLDREGIMLLRRGLTIGKYKPLWE